MKEIETMGERRRRRQGYKVRRKHNRIVQLRNHKSLFRLLFPHKRINRELTNSISKSLPHSMTEKTSNTAGSGSGDSHLERMPNNIINEILLKLEMESLCAVACTSQTLHSASSQILSSLSSLHLSGFSPDSDTVKRIRQRFGKLKRVTLDCLRLRDSTVCTFLGPHIQELILPKCSRENEILALIGKNCPDLRELDLELAGFGFFPEKFQRNLLKLLEGCPLLESICIKIHGGYASNAGGFTPISTSLPKTVKFLKLQPMLKRDALGFFPGSPTLTLKCLSLVLDVITDDLIIAIVNSLPLLAELDLEDRTEWQPSLPHDLSNIGLQSLGHCKHLTSLSLIRSRQLSRDAHFEEISDMGMSLLSEGCKGLESIKLDGFSRVSDAGFASLLNSFQNLKKFEIHNAELLSDISKVPLHLVEVRLMSCNNITRESVEELASSSVLEVLDLLGCRSITDSCMGIISSRYTLTHLNLGGADITDSGMAILGKGNSPITYLCLRSCKRVTDEGIKHLLQGGGKISKTLSFLDISYIPGISDLAIETIAANAPAITELCLRFCCRVTDASIQALASPDRRRVGFIRRLDFYNCTGLSTESLKLLKKPYFPGLHWIGVGMMNWTGAALARVCKERPLLTACPDACEMGCHVVGSLDGWRYHEFDRRW